MLWGHENIKGLSSSSVKKFWQWTYSDIMINKNREDFGLFLVAHALELTKMPRINWGNIDLRYQRKKISVKTSGYIQSWKQKKSKRILFDISKKKGIDAKKEDSLTFRNREADLYVFNFHNEKVVKEANVLDLNQWDFYIVLTSVLDEHYPDKNKIGLRSLNKIATKVKYDRVKEIIDDLIDCQLTNQLNL